jgi:hypothetical protein
MVDDIVRIVSLHVGSPRVESKKMSGVRNIALTRPNF